MNKKNYYGLSKGRTTLILFLLICSVTKQLNGQQNNDYVDSIIVHKTFPLISYLKQSPEVLKTLQKTCHWFRRAPPIGGVGSTEFCSGVYNTVY